MPLVRKVRLENLGTFGSFPRSALKRLSRYAFSSLILYIYIDRYMSKDIQSVKPPHFVLLSHKAYSIFYTPANCQMIPLRCSYSERVSPTYFNDPCDPQTYGLTFLRNSIQVQMNSDEIPVWLFYIGDYTTQLEVTWGF